MANPNGINESSLNEKITLSSLIPNEQHEFINKQL